MIDRIVTATGFVQKHEAKGQEPVFFLLVSDLHNLPAPSH